MAKSIPIFRVTEVNETLSTNAHLNGIDTRVGIKRSNINTEAKRCFATHDEDIDYFNMRIYIILIACVYIQQFNFVQ